MSDIERNAVIIGITGGIACGKSEVGRILEKMGYAVCDADRVAHDLMAKGTPVFQRVVECFGERILSDNGEISRPLLGEVVFGNGEQRECLNRLVHPAVKEVLAQWIASHRSAGENAAVQVPLLFESGMDVLDWDAILCVSSGEPVVFDRLEKRGISRHEAEKRIRSQLPLAEKEQLSDRVILNQGSLRELEEATRMAMDSLSVERKYERRKRSC